MHKKHNKAFEEGRMAALSGQLPTTCPYTSVQKSKHWQEGYSVAINELLAYQEAQYEEE